MPRIATGGEEEVVVGRRTWWWGGGRSDVVAIIRSVENATKTAMKNLPLPRLETKDLNSVAKLVMGSGLCLERCGAPALSRHSPALSRHFPVLAGTLRPPPGQGVLGVLPCNNARRSRLLTQGYPVLVFVRKGVLRVYSAQLSVTPPGEYTCAAAPAPTPQGVI